MPKLRAPGVVVAGLLSLAGCAAQPAAEQHSGGSIGSAQMPVTAAPPPVSAIQAEAGDRVFFSVDSAVLTADAQQRLAITAKFMAQNPALTLLIEGHCDERGTREYNFALGERRGTAVRDFLVAQGVAPHRLTVISFGKERPAVVGAGDSVWSQNRRAVLVMSPSL